MKSRSENELTMRMVLNVSLICSRVGIIRFDRVRSLCRLCMDGICAQKSLYLSVSRSM